jgi:hypothetical protein
MGANANEKRIEQAKTANCGSTRLKNYT